MTTKLFGREPAAWVSLIEALIAMLSITVLHWSTDQIAVVMAVVVAVFAVYTAYATHATMLGVIVGLVKAVFALLIGFGLSLSPEFTAGVISLVTVSVGFWQRTQVSPLDSGNFDLAA